MTHKEQILNTLEKETAVCKRLYSLISPDMMNYSPKEGMRTTHELLKYISWCAVSCVENYMAEPDKNKGIYARNADYGDTMKTEDFPVRMDEQMERIKSLLAKVSDDDLLTKEVLVPWQQPYLLGEALIETAVKWMTGYKMQLYLYMKMNGVELDTGDCWIQVEK